jgi:head-tail adaptor
MMAIDPGKMRDRVRIEKRGEYDPETGVEHWVSAGVVWAEYRGQSGREFREGVTALGEERATFLINYREDIRQIDRLVYLGRGGNYLWDIQSIQPFGFKDGLLVLALKRDNVGPVE